MIREQAKVLEEYRAEIFRLRENQQQQKSHSSAADTRKRGRQPSSATAVGKPREGGGESAGGGGGGGIFRERVLMSDEEDSWSEPDVSASRKRMGISQHALTLIEGIARKNAADSSEFEDKTKQKG